MRNPYDVLGVPQSATDEEIKKAYRKLSRIYHPDSNIDNPNKDEAEERFKEIQQAYQRIMDDREKGYTGGYDSSGRATGYGSSGYGYGYDERQQGYGGFGGFGPFAGFGGFGGFGSAGPGAQQDIHLQAAENYIRNGHYNEALRVLSDIPDRGARWFYCSALANSGLGNNVTAKEHARQAASMEPDNFEYRNLVNTLDNRGQAYRTMGDAFGSPMAGGGSMCTTMGLAYLCCCLSGGRCMFCC